MVSFKQSIINFWTKYFDFNGCAQRSEYWFWVLFNVIVMVSFFIINFATLTRGINIVQEISLVDNLWVIATFIPGIALMSRRFHDAGFSAKFIWIPWLTFFGAELLIYFMAVSLRDPSIFTDGNLLVDIAIIAWGIFGFVVSVLPSKLKGNPYRK